MLTLAELDSTWRQATADVTAPPGASHVNVDFLNAAGIAGDVLFLDDITVQGP